MSRLVAISNRVGTIGSATHAGGLAVALAGVLKAHHGLWFGWNGKTSQAADPEPTMVTDEDVTVATIPLRKADLDGYYSGFSNRCLWPLLHFRLDLTAYEPSDYQAYQRVNHRFATVLKTLLKPDDLIWVHDYHFLIMARALRQLGVTQRLAFFLHTPMPPRELFSALPNHVELMTALLDYDLIGFQTEADVAHFIDYAVVHHGASAQGQWLTLGSRRIRAAAFPVGIDVGEFEAMACGVEARAEFARVRRHLGRTRQIIGVDRMDYSKGLLRRLSAFEHFLRAHPSSRGLVHWLQIAPASRSELKAYGDFRDAFELGAADINGRYGDIDWTPVRYLSRPLSRSKLAGLYRASAIGLVTPMRDGMNLVAKEYVAAQDPANPGVLVLSRFAGAAAQMTAALIVNPYDPDEVSDAIHTGLDMPLAERQARHTELLEGLRREDAKGWADQFVNALAG